MLTLASRRVLTPEGLHPAVVRVEDGRIAAITEDPAPEGAIDLGEDVLMAGLVDCHVHINEPGRTEWEGFETATAAAAVGGITTVIDMPLNSVPVTTSAAALEEKIAASRGKLWVDCGFWGGVVPGNAPELAPMAEAGALGFKAFLCHSGIDDFPNSTADDLRIAMPILRRAGRPLLVHAELESDIQNAFADASPRAYLRYLHSRPREFEDAAIALVIELVRETGCRAHIVHLSSATALPMLASARAEGLPLTVETCPHYLCLSAEEVPDGATEYKCAPPIREDENRERLWQGLAAGVIDFVISDHSPCVPSLKLPEEGDFMRAWGGIASLQLGLSSIWTEAIRRGHSLSDVARWMSASPARFAGLPGRGSLAVGQRADLVAFRPDALWTVSPDRLFHRHKVSPYLGRRLHGAVQATWLGGELIAAEGSLRGESPRGKAILAR